MIETLRDLLAPYATTRSALLAAVAGFALYRTRSHFAGGRLSPSDAKKDLSGKIYIVTGGCGGIGLETVRQLALQGGHVIAAARDYPKSHEYLEKMKRGLPKEAAERIEFGAIDLADLDSVRKFAEKFIGSGRSLDCLINNAGIMALPRQNFSAQAHELQFATNHLGHALLTFLLLDTLKKTASHSGHARIINVSSAAHRRGAIDFADLNNSSQYDGWKTYGDSKLANIMFSVGLAWGPLKGTGVVANALHPGVITTELGRHSLGKVQWIMRLLYPLVWLFFKNPREGAQTTLHLAISNEGSKITGSYWADCERAKLRDALGQSSRPEDIERLMDVTKQLVGV